MVPLGKSQKKKKVGRGVPVGRGDGSGQGGVERSIKVIVKMPKTKKSPGVRVDVKRRIELL